MQTKTKITIYLILAAAISTIVSIFIMLNQVQQENTANASITKISEAQVDGTTQSTGTTSANNSKIATDQNNNSVIVWTATDTATPNIFYKKIDKDGTTIISPARVDTTTTNAQTSPDVAIDKNGNFFITWTESGGGIYLKAFKNDGTQIGSTTQIKTSGSETKIAATYEKYAPNTTRIVISFTYTNTDDDILFRTYDINTGSSPSITYISETTVPGTTTGTQQKSDIAINKNGYVIISWTDLNSNNIKYKIYKNDGTVLQTDTNANTYSIANTATSSVATDKQLQYAELDENKFIITYDAQINANGDNGIATKIITYQAICSESTELIVNDTSNPTEDSANPEVSADFMGNYTIVWEQPTYDGSQTLINKDIEGQSYNNTGKKVGSNFQVNTIHTTNYQTHPAISMNEEGTYNITFTENSADIYIKKTQKYSK